MIPSRLLLVLALASLEAVCAACLASCAPTSVSNAQRASSSASSSTAQKEFEAKCKEITAECTDLGEHAWAGEYVGLPNKLWYLRLFLAPKAGAVLEFQSDDASRDPEFDFGTVNERDGRVTIQWGRGSASRLDELFPVRWGERRYLVSEKNVPEFFSVAEANGNMRWPESFLLVADFTKPGQGVPQLPEAVKKTTTTIVGTIAALGSEKDRGSGEVTLEITLDIGIADGLAPRMMCQLNASDDLKVQIQVQSLGERETKCAAIYRTGALRDPSVLAIGTKVTFTKTSIAK